MRARIAVLAVAVAAAAAFAVFAAEPQPAAQEAPKAPEFQLFGVDYHYHSLAKYKDAKAVVVVFTCNHCPVAKSYEDKLVELANKYQPQGIQFIAINPNPAEMVPEDGFPEMIQRAKEKKFPFPYVYDETQKTAIAYGAKVTPHIFVVAPDRTILYEGGVDNRNKEPNYLANALDAILAGKPIETPEAAYFGCTVKYRPQAAKELREKEAAAKAAAEGGN
jgi:peroxiredoxin